MVMEFIVVFIQDYRGQRSLMIMIIGIHYITNESGGYEFRAEYNEMNLEIHYRDNSGYERWKKYNNRGDMIGYRSSYGYIWGEDPTKLNNNTKRKQYEKSIMGSKM
jgi:hypothetical protein